MAYNVTLDGGNKIVAERMLENIARILTESKIEYWLEGGTLLGIRRENRLLPWDNDVDLSILSSETTKLKDFYKKLKKANYRVRERFFETSSSPFISGDLRIIKIREKGFLGLTKGNVCVEIFVKYNYKEDSYWEIAGKKKQVPSKFYNTISTIEFNNYQYSIPKLTDDYLTYRYGDWKVPVKDWDTFNDDKALS